MLGRMIDKEAQTETILLEKSEVDALKAEIIRLNNQIAFYRLTEFELRQYEENVGCRIVLAVTLFIRKVINGIRRSLNGH